MILSFRTSTYARSIYIFGTDRLANIPSEYVEPVKQYSAKNYTREQIDNALAQGWITQEEYDQTITYPQV
jgi:predicted DNA-binding ArsR family transcriptional regulator